MRKRKLECSEPHCRMTPYAKGLCEEHFKEQVRKEGRRDAAVRLLHSSCLDDQPLENPELREELRRVQVWWRRVCDTINYKLKDPVLADEAEHALSWCIALAEEIVDAENAYRNGKSRSSYSLEGTREWVWDRFRNLEAGLMSNGVPRRKENG